METGEYKNKMNLNMKPRDRQFPKGKNQNTDGLGLRLNLKRRISLLEYCIRELEVLKQYFT